MDFNWTEEQKSFREAVVRFAQTHLNENLINRDESSSFSPEAWKKCAEFGIQGLPVPESYGGQGADPLTTVLALEALGYGCTDNGLLFSINAQMWSCEVPILKFGSEDQKRHFLPGLCDGSLIGVQAMTEPESGSDAFAMGTVAQPQNGGYVIKGTKTFITNAPIADVFVVFAVTDSSKGFAGISAFLVERDAPGLTVGHPFKKMGLRTSPMSEVILDGCQIPETSMLGKPGAGMMVFNSSMDWERGFILATCVGTMHRQLDHSLNYAQERKQFGQPIGSFQAISHKLVNMKVRLETARLLLYRLGWLKGQRASTAADAAIVKLYLSECFVQSSLDALQVHGGYGYMVDSELEREVRDALASRIYSGTSEIQKNIIAHYLGLGA